MFNSPAMPSHVCFLMIATQVCFILSPSAQMGLITIAAAICAVPLLLKATNQKSL